METRSRTRLLLRGAAVLVALGALTAPATAGAAVKAPVIKKVTPKHVTVGHKLIIRGKYFRRGKGRDNVLFRRAHGKALFVKARLSTTRMMEVVVPTRLEAYMTIRNGNPVPTRFRIRVLARRLSRAFTPARMSPVIAPAQSAAGNGGAPPANGGGHTSAPTCPQLAAANPAGDADSDGLNNGLELALGTLPCNKDSDGDGIWDSFEYWSALDLNRGNASVSIPYPGKKPYPNPLDGSDANTDHDGDSLTLAEEFQVWLDPRYGRQLPPPNMDYSDGKQMTVSTAAPDAADIAHPERIWSQDPTLRFLDTNRNGAIEPSELLELDFNRDGVIQPSEFDYQDINGDGKLQDDERDIDADGLTNYDETVGRMTPGYWASAYKAEPPYSPFVAFDATKWLDPDSDGDRVVDGLDDQDDDGFDNLHELSRFAAQVSGAANESAYGQVNPFNPCLPAQSNPFTDLNTGLPTTQLSPDCMRHPPFDGAPAPFDPSSAKYPFYAIAN